VSSTAGTACLILLLCNPHPCQVNYSVHAVDSMPEESHDVLHIDVEPHSCPSYRIKVRMFDCGSPSGHSMHGAGYSTLVQLQVITRRRDCTIYGYTKRCCSVCKVQGMQKSCSSCQCSYQLSVSASILKVSISDVNSPIRMLKHASNHREGVAPICHTYDLTICKQGFT
jgi:hypothetical protein